MSHRHGHELAGLDAAAMTLGFASGQFTPVDPLERRELDGCRWAPRASPRIASPRMLPKN